jgi:hypothetical protein
MEGAVTRPDLPVVFFDAPRISITLPIQTVNHREKLADFAVPSRYRQGAIAALLR